MKMIASVLLAALASGASVRLGNRFDIGDAEKSEVFK
jgi:hypothetical protein